MLRSLLSGFPSLRYRWLAGLLLLGLAASAVLAFREPLWRQLSRRRAERFVNAGFRAWQEGRTREARLSLQSATTLVPDNLRAWRLLARMDLQQGQLAEAREIFGRLIALSPDAESRAGNAGLYLDSLLGTGFFAEASGFATAEFARRPKAELAGWALAAFHGARIAGTSSALAQGAADPVTAPGLLALRRLAAAQEAWQQGRHSEARAALDGATASELPWALRVAGAKLALSWGDRGRARVLLYGGAGELDPAEQLAAAWLLGTHTQVERMRLARQMFAGDPPMPVLLGRISALLPIESAELPLELAVAAGPRSSALPESVLAGFWLLWEINRPGQRDNPWKKPLAEMIHFEPLPLPSSRLSPAQFAGMVNRLPLARDSVLALLARVESGPPAEPEIRSQTPGS